MKDTLVCPKCGCDRIWAIDEVKQPDAQTRAIGAMAVTALSFPLKGRLNEWLAEHGEIVAGRFEVWVCAQCGFTEWYAKEMNEALEEMARRPDSGVRLAGRQSGGPFR